MPRGENTAEVVAIMTTNLNQGLESELDDAICIKNAIKQVTRDYSHNRRAK